MLAVEQLSQRFQRKVILLHLLHLGQELVGQNEISGLEAGRLQDVDDLGRDHGPTDDLLDCQLTVFRVAPAPAAF